MKAAVYHGPQDVRIEQVSEPEAVGPEEVLLQVRMGALCGTDVSQFKAATMIPLTQPHPASGHRGPVILGHELVGVIVERGAKVAHLQVGERVVPGAGMWCGKCHPCLQGRSNICEKYFLYGIHANGGLAEFAKFPAKMCVPVPDACTDESAAMAQPCAIALHALSRGRITSEQFVALFGVGSIGSLLLASLQVQTAGKARVIAVDVEATRLDTALAIGASYRIDAGTIDPVAAIHELTGGRGVDVAIEATGVSETVAQALASVRKGGLLLQVGIPVRPVSLFLDQAVQHEKDIVMTNGQINNVDLPKALQLLAETDLAARIGYRVIALDALVDEGFMPLLAHRATAKVLVEISEAGGGC